MKHQLVVSLIGISLITTATPASAYLDPGTGSIILQGALAAIAGAIVVLKLYWMRVKYFFSSIFSSKESVDAQSTTTAFQNEPPPEQ